MRLCILTITATFLLFHSCEKKSDFLLGVDESRSGNYNRAIELLSKSIKNHPFRSEAYFERGKAKGFLGFYDEALIDLNRAIEIEEHPAYLNTRSAIHSNQGNFEFAIQDATRAIKLKENYKDAYYNRASALTEIGEFDNAVHDYSKVLEMEPSNSLARFLLGIAHQRNGNIKEACENWEEAVSHGSNDAKGYLLKYCD